MPRLPSDTEASVRAHLNPDFRFERNETAPLAIMRRPVSQSRGCLITTGGVFVKGETPFSDNYGIGDPSYREIPSRTSPKRLTRFHEHYDHTNAIRDINCIFPIDRMRELAETGTIGSVADTYYSFMGYLTVAHPLKTITAPAVARRMKNEGVEFAVLVPV